MSDQRRLRLILLAAGVVVIALALFFARNAAFCRDGWVTFSAGQQGACSGHGGLLR